MKYLLDTNICIYLIKQRPPEVIRRFRTLDAGEIGVSSVTLSELYYGAAKSAFPERNHAALDEFLLPFELSPYDQSAAIAYGQLRAELERKGTPIGPLDQMIAAHALSLSLTLVTNNVREFRRVRGLRVENWASGR